MRILVKYCYAIFFSLTLLACTHSNPEAPASAQVIPQPAHIEVGGGIFEWEVESKIVVTQDDTNLNQIGLFLQQILSTSTAHKVEIQQGSSDTQKAILLTLDNTIEGDEAYRLDISENRIDIKASQPAGIFYGVQTLLQLLPPEVLKANGLIDGFRLNTISINDSPRFPYRGMHLDVSRNFVSKEDVKKFIDLIAMYKFNRFHWHLTDGAGWRIEIKKYPLLTQKTAFRAQKTWKEFWNEGGRRFVDEGTPNAYGGYYTQDDVREVVAYAAQRYITIIPEIEMPAHSEEVFVAYPQFSCSGKPYVDSDYCAGNDETFTFVEDVLTEVIDLFPSQYIHIGGDEAGKASWKTCPKCRKRIKDENLKNVDELQSYFIKRISKFLESKGRKLIGWDEIIDGGLPADATVMLWRDPKMGIHAAQLGHQVIMTPGSHCYFDMYQDDPATEPEAIGGYLPLRKVYSFEVVPNDSLASFFIGGQANLWAEYMNDFEQVEYMAFPRILALSEALWSPKDSRDWDNFKGRLRNQLPRLKYLDVNYHQLSYQLEMFQEVDTLNKQIKVNFESEQYRPIIRYTLDGSEPTTQSQLYEDTIVISKPAILKASIFVDDKPQGVFAKQVGYHLAIGKKVSYHTNWTSYPAGGETALVDGLTGGLSYGDELWQGFTTDMNVTIDLGKVETLNSLNANFMQLTGPGVYMPDYVEVSISTDGKKFEKILKVTNDIPEDVDRLRFKDFGGSLEGKQARYINVFAKNQKGFLFTDELIVN